jgi:hypothetical protein
MTGGSFGGLVVAHGEQVDFFDAALAGEMHYAVDDGQQV